MRDLSDIRQIALASLALDPPHRLPVDVVDGSENQRVLAHTTLCEHGLIGAECVGQLIENSLNNAVDSFRGRTHA